MNFHLSKAFTARELLQAFLEMGTYESPTWKIGRSISSVRTHPGWLGFVG